MPAGFGFLLKNPPLWPLAALPAVLTVVLIVIGLVASWYLAPTVEAALAPSRDKVGDLLALLAWLTLAMVTFVAGMLLGFALALILTAPILDLLSRRVERRTLGEAKDISRGLRFEVVESLRGAFYFALALPFAFLIGLLPVIGPPLAALWAASTLAFQLTDGALSRRGFDFASKRRWHAHWRAEMLGFGLLCLVALLVPFANLIVGPALMVGATRLVGELGPDPGPPLPVPRGSKRAGGEVGHQEGAAGQV